MSGAFDWRLLGFLLFVMSVQVSGFVYLHRRLRAAAATLAPRAAPALKWVVGALFLLQMLSFSLTRSGLSGPVAGVLFWSAYVLFGVVALVFVGTLLIDAASGLATLAERAGLTGAPDPGRRALLRSWAQLGVVGVSGALTAGGYRAATRVPAVTEVEVPITGLPPALHGFRIAQISDVHIGPTIKGPWLQKVVDVINDLDVDLVAVTGDLVDGDADALADDVAPLGTLRARHGAFFCTGNHEYYSGVDAWVAAVAGLGLRPLLNAHQLLDHDGARVLVAGVTDRSAHRVRPDHASDPAQAIAGRDADGDLRLLLAHQPRSAYPAAALDFFHLQLSGHTHGGQFAPFSFFIGLFQPFAVGLHRLGSMWIYTNRGTGYWGPPNRLGSPSEITLLRLIPGD